jgi:hypothetical protein
VVAATTPCGHSCASMKPRLVCNAHPAARARDRKAYELNGEHAYLNRPEDLRR